MKAREVSAQVPEKKDAQGKVVQKALGPVSIMVDFPETLDEAKGWCGDEAILSNAWAHFRVSPLQSGIRSLLKAGKTQEQIQTELGKTVMGVARTPIAVDPQQAFLAQFKTATPEKQQEMLKMLREAAQNK